MTVFNLFGEYCSDLLHLLFPEICDGCGNNLKKGEDVICLYCRHFLPKTDFIATDNNPVEKCFWGRVKIEKASAFLYFQKAGSKVQKLMHALKYKDKREVGVKLGKMYGVALIENDRFKDIELIIPVPLYWKKEKLRGYNQSEMIAQGIAEVMNKPMNSKLLEREIGTETQTRKSRMQRWENVADVFIVKSHAEIEGKHILIVDDVITTGATLEACAHALLTVSGTKVSIAALAFAQ